VSCEKRPPDAELDPRCAELAASLASLGGAGASTDARALVRALILYIDARIDVMAAGRLE